MLLTPEQLREIRQIVEVYHSAFIANTISPDVLAPDMLARLRRLGLINTRVDTVGDAYIYGQILAVAEDPKFASMGYEEFKRYLRTHPVPLTSIERDAMAFARHRAGDYCRGLGNRVSQQTGEILKREDSNLRRQMLYEIKTATERNIAERETRKKLKSDLGWATKDWARDWQRIANTETHFAMQRGVAELYGKRYGEKSRVAVRAMPDACKDCNRLFVGSDKQPIIFRLGDLEANGTNVGRKAADWLPVVPPVHPHCQCQLIRVPDGWGFNEDGQLVPDGELGEAYGKSDAYWRVRRADDLHRALEHADAVDYQGIRVRIENPIGSVRRWRDQSGREGATRMHCAYGYAERTTGADGDGVDVFLGPNPEAPRAWIVHQQNPHNGAYDEDKVMLGFSDQRSAINAYEMHYDKPAEFFAAVSEVTIDQLRRWLDGTEVEDVERALPSKQRLRLVVPLTKATATTFHGSDGAALALLGPAAEHAQRQSPSPGTSGNYAVGSVLRSPMIQQVGWRPTPREELELMQQDETDLHHWFRDKSIYQIPEQVPHAVKIVVPVKHQGSFPIEEAERNKDHVEEQQRRRVAAQRNLADIVSPRERLG